jgi:hypothetical protein
MLKDIIRTNAPIETEVIETEVYRLFRVETPSGKVSHCATRRQAHEAAYIYATQDELADITEGVIVAAELVTFDESGYPEVWSTVREHDEGLREYARVEREYDEEMATAVS